MNSSGMSEWNCPEFSRSRYVPVWAQFPSFLSFVRLDFSISSVFSVGVNIPTPPASTKVSILSTAPVAQQPGEELLHHRNCPVVDQISRPPVDQIYLEKGDSLLWYVRTSEGLTFDLKSA